MQESSTFHKNTGFPLSLGKKVTVSHQAMLHGYTIGDGALIGIQAVLLNGAQIGKNCLVGVGALVTEDKEFPDNSLISGSPAKVARTLSEQLIAALAKNGQHYVKHSAQYKTNFKSISE